MAHLPAGSSSNRIELISFVRVTTEKGEAGMNVRKIPRRHPRLLRFSAIRRSNRKSLRVSDLAASYSRSIGEAAFRRDTVTIVTHLIQLRACCRDMFQLFKDLPPD